MHLQETVQELRTELAESRHKADTLGQLLRAHEQKHRCETLYTEGRIIDTGISLLEITNTVSEDVRAHTLIMDWLAGMSLCRVSEERIQSYHQSLQINAHRCWN